MTDLIDYIDEQIGLCLDSVTAFGLCHLIADTGGIYPATVASEARRVAPDQRTTVLTYHRLLNGSIEPSEELSFGRRITAVASQRVRLVVFIELDADQTLIDDIINALPDDFEYEGYQFARVSKSIELIRDRAAIWNEEFGESYSSKYQKRFQIYAVEYSLEYVKCRVCETSP